MAWPSGSLMTSIVWQFKFVQQFQIIVSIPAESFLATLQDPPLRFKTVGSLWVYKNASSGAKDNLLLGGMNDRICSSDSLLECNGAEGVGDSVTLIVSPFPIKKKTL